MGITSTRDEDEYLHPKRQCDLIMKGGLTSGIAYPLAVLEIAKEYRFRSIGGTSAGAIAAALTAAAEYGRENGGFRRLKEVSDELCQGSRIEQLFQPSQATRPLMKVLLEGLRRYASKRSQGQQQGHRSRRAFIGEVAKWTGRALFDLPVVLFKSNPLLYGTFVISGLVSGFFGTLIFLRGLMLHWQSAGWFVVAGILGLMAGWIIGAAGMALFLSRVAIKHIPSNFYGICSGHEAGREGKDARALTDWLHVTINRLAGRKANEAPLTFGDLRKKVGREDSDEELAITVRMMAANLSQSQPLSIPFEGQLFIAKEAEMSALFPNVVAQHMLSHAARKNEIRFAKSCKGCHVLPADDDLPVVVAARLSLGFPLLLSAVPFHTIARSALLRWQETGSIQIEADDLQRNWLSDGGIASNFPIHFFDAWLPSRPTFGINLMTLPEETFEVDAPRATEGSRTKEKSHIATRRKIRSEKQAVAISGSTGVEEQGARDVRAMLDAESPDHRADAGESVYLPQADEISFPAWSEINGIIGLLMSVWTTAQNYRDTMQSQLPSYRERVVEVRFSPLEGGINLVVKGAQLEALIDKGRQAGALLRNSFCFPRHRWVRFLVLMAQLEAQLTKTRGPFPDGNAYKNMIRKSLVNDYPFKHDRAWCDEAERRMDAVLELLATWDGPHVGKKKPRPDDVFFAKDAPLPPSVLRVVPTV